MGKGHQLTHTQTRAKKIFTEEQWISFVTMEKILVVICFFSCLFFLHMNCIHINFRIVIDDNHTTKTNIERSLWELVRTKFKLFETNQHTNYGMKYTHELVWVFCQTKQSNLYTYRYWIPVQNRFRSDPMCASTLYVCTVQHNIQC